MPPGLSETQAVSASMAPCSLLSSAGGSPVRHTATQSFTLQRHTPDELFCFLDRSCTRLNNWPRMLAAAAMTAAEHRGQQLDLLGRKCSEASHCLLSAAHNCDWNVERKGGTGRVLKTQFQVFDVCVLERGHTADTRAKARNR